MRPLAIWVFLQLVDVALVNANLLWNKDSNDRKKRFNFLLEVSDEVKYFGTSIYY
jgi:hypothetical protein